MTENIHYIRIEKDLSNLASVSRIVTSNDSADINWMKNITENAFSLAMDTTYPKEVLRVASDLTSIFRQS